MVLIQGTNIPNTDGRSGFYTTRFVRTLNAESAESEAVSEINGEIKRHHSLESLQKSDARMHLREVKQIPFFPRKRGGGFCWYDQDDHDAGQSALDLELEAYWS